MKKRSLSQKLFRTYVGWFTAYLLILACISIGYMAFSVKKNVRDTQERLIKSIDENVQNYFERMNAFSLELMNSEAFRQSALNELPTEYKNRKSTTKVFSHLYRDAYKIMSNKYNVGVVVDDSYYIWMGNHYYIGSLKGKEIHTYDNLVKDETPIIKYLETNEYLEQTNPKAEKPQSYITLSRSMDASNNKYLDGKGILEIQVKKEAFVNEIMKLSLKGGTSNFKINIYDSEGQAIYQESNMNLSKYVKTEGEKDYKKNGAFINVRKIFDDNVTIVYVQDSAVYYQKLFEFWGMALALSLLVIGIMFWVTYKITKQISQPIHSMCEHVHEINLKEGVGYKEITTDIDELQFLSYSLKQMSDQIEESLQEIISLKDYEVHAKMLALQAQMQPHFLFNTLTTIASMAEAEGNRKIYRICMNLNSMFRYIAAENREGVQMFEEIKHINSYVEIMKERFTESTVEIDIPLEMMDCRIPKLTIQPLVENAFKYCNREKPDIHVKGSMMESGRWIIEVLDNGTGFSVEKKKEIMQKCQEGLKNEKTLSNQIDGMGLVNVYVRMKLFYGDNMFYFIEENRGRIIVGGVKNEDKSNCS